MSVAKIVALKKPFPFSGNGFLFKAAEV